MPSTPRFSSAAMTVRTLSGDPVSWWVREFGVSLVDAAQTLTPRQVKDGRRFRQPHLEAVSASPSCAALDRRSVVNPAVRDLRRRTARPMYRSLLVAGAVTCLAACGLSPNSPAPVQTPVTGRWSGTFESSWGTLPVNADLTNERGTLNISGNFTVDGQRASGTVNGMLETRDRYAGPLFWGSLTISYRTASGETCRSESVFDSTSGSGSENALFFSAQGFPKGNCPDPPTNVRISLRR